MTLSKGAPYYYVEGCDALLALVLDDGLQVIREEAARLTAADATPLDELVAFGGAHVRCAIEGPSGPLIITNVDDGRTAELLHPHEDAARAIIRRAVAVGQLRDVHPGHRVVGAADLAPRPDHRCTRPVPRRTGIPGR